ncbi:MAG: DUF4397 domain-containing protein [Chlorobiota bacterium]|jgi:hypothetical protein|nr:MAG: DUF4397 domain-containing protein [Chlorobiota bacterium]
MAHAAWSSRFVLNILLCAAALTEGCQDGVVTFTGGTAYIRLFNAQTKTNAVTLYADSVRRIELLLPGMTSSAITVPSGTYVLLDVRSASDTAQRIASQRYVMADGQSYTVIVRGRTITDFFRPIVDTAQSPFAGRAAVKIINVSEETFVTVNANGSPLGLPVVDAQTVLPFTSLEAGTVRLSVLDADRNVTIGSDSTVVLDAGECYYLFVHDVRSGTEVMQRWFLRKVH